MSREFGSYTGGYFHDQMRYAAEDCEGGKDELTKLWGKFFRSFEEVAYAIASSEACDSGPDHPILETIKSLPRLKESLTEIERFCAPFESLMKQAVREALEEKQKTKK